MNAFTNSRLLVLSIAASALLGATHIVVARQTPSALNSVPVCIKSNGQLRVLVAAGASCDSSERRADWVVGGELIEIALGHGLIGGRQGGTFQLAINPAVVEKGIFSGFNDGPVTLPTGFPQEIARLDLPAGYFTIFAKMTVTNTLDAGFDDRVLCRLSAEADFDEAELVLPENVRTVIVHPYNAAAGLTMQLVHRFTTPGSVILTCFEQDSEPDLSYRDLKITAIEASTLSNVFLATP